MVERSSPDIVDRLENRAETLAQTALNGRDTRLIKLLETAAQEIKALRASQPATPTGGDSGEVVIDGSVQQGDNLTYELDPEKGLGRILSHTRPTAMARSSAGTVEAIERIAEVIREEVRTTDSGIVHNSTDVAKKVLAALRSVNAAQAAPVPALAEFFKWAMREGPWEGGDLDGGSIQDKAESLGLIVRTKFDPEKHGTAYGDFSEGDDYYEFAPGVSIPSTDQAGGK